MSISEEFFWRSVRRDGLGFRFRRQVAVGPYYLDFYCPEASLAIEIDGPHHQHRIEADLRRDEYLASVGVLTHRITTSQVWEESEAVWVGALAEVKRICEERSGRSAFPEVPHPTLPQFRSTIHLQNQGRAPEF
jgi:very-short-patch-repair endonuclease